MRISFVVFTALLGGCAQPVDADGDGYAAEDDCDDTVAAIHPDAAEVCNGLDDNCDGNPDEDVSVAYYTDDDGDGHGSATAEAIVACDQPRGKALLQDDCDDTVATAHPGAIEFCDGLDDDCDGAVDEEAVDAPTWFADTDGDGFGDPNSAVTSCESPEGSVPDASDCDDAVLQTNPDATELCNGVDDDCDGVVDEDDAQDAVTWHIDYDADGFGATGFDVVACAMPAGYAATDDDCDDTVATTNPAGTEVCDEVDDDCDGNIDEDDAVDALAWYPDDDGDGFGADVPATLSCAQRAGFVADATDCDDADASAFPGADERCDGVDDDCDGTADESPAVDAPTWHADTDGDGYGDLAAPTVACEAPNDHVTDATDCDDTRVDVYPGATDTLYDGVDSDCDGASDYDADLDGFDTSDAGWGGADCDDADATVNPDAVEVCDDGIDNDCDATSNTCGITGDVDLAVADAILYGEAAGDAAGWSVSGVGDIDGDGFAEVVIGAPTASSGTDGPGAAWLVAGPASGGLAAARATMLGELDGDSAGWAVAGPGDVDGDGIPDVLVGAPRVSGIAANAGAVYLVGGTATGSVALSGQTVWAGEAAWDYAGTALSGTGDLDGDGLSDVAVGAWGADVGGGDAGVAYWVRGGSASGSLATSAARLYGEALFDAAGRSVAAAGDLDGTGIGGMLIGAPGQDGGGAEAGAAYLVLGAPSGDVDLADAEARLLGVAAGDAAGTTVSGAGDTDRDGYEDVLVGAPGNDDGGDGAGIAYLVRGPVTGDLALSDADAWFIGEADGDAAGTGAAGAGDVDGDGFSDVLLGAPGSSGDRSFSGLAYLVRGPAMGAFDLFNADARLLGESAAASAGHAVAGAGDVDGDGDDDVLVGAYGDDGNGALSGAAYLLFSGGL